MVKDLQPDHGLHICFNKTLKAKHHDFGMIYRDNDKSFQMLPSYLYMLERNNLGLQTKFQTDEGKFQYIFVSLVASINGFRNCCRPVIVVDGTHLKGKYKGTMFVAASKDGDEHVFPLAFGIGDKKSDNSWTWFLTEVQNTFGCLNNLLIVSDQHISISNAIDEVHPEAVHGLCAYHIQNNLASDGKEIFRLLRKQLTFIVKRNLRTIFYSLLLQAMGI
ncbi:hypothetical protein PTKIN_Ptkin04bG0125900 [Pterospermum kingtungense]